MMRKNRHGCGIVVAIAMWAASVQALAAPARAADAPWRGEYFNNAELAGAPAFTRSDPVIDFDWGLVAPSPALNNDNYSARWTRNVDFAAGEYEFSATSDDGVRMYVDGEVVIDQWVSHPPQTHKATRPLSGGAHQLTVEFYEATGRAQVKVSWKPISVRADTWQAEYYANTSLAGAPAVQRSEEAVDFDWGTGSPAPGVLPNDNFSARWTRVVDLAAGAYRFTLSADDGARLYVNNQLVLDAWQVQGARSFVADVTVPGGQTALRMEYFEASGVAQAALAWSRLQTTADGWRGEYFANPALAGAPIVTRDDPQIDFNWGTSSPAPGVPADGFSARWTRTLNVPTGWYRATITVDDGARLYVNDTLVLDAWQVQAAQTRTADVQVGGGVTTLRLEYYENGGYASVSLKWSEVNETIRNWRGEYYNNITLSGTPAVVRDDAAIAFNWADGAPAAGVNADQFSARWTRNLSLEAGWWRFTLAVDDGARLWVNNTQAIDVWQIGGARPFQADVYVPGGSVPVKLEYFEDSGWASAQLAWAKLQAAPGTVSPPSTEIVIDDTDGGFVKGGPANGWSSAPEGYGSHLTWARSYPAAGSDVPQAWWYPRLAAGRYEVFVFIPDRYTTTSSAVYLVSHAGGAAQRIVSQSANGGRWVSLGAYDFRGDDRDFVSLSAATGEGKGARLVGFDAVKWTVR
jgi:hypothetical protein